MVSNTKTILVIGIIVVVIVVAAAAVVLSGDDDDDDSGHEVAITAEPYFSDKLMVYGNANDDDTIDSKDIDTIRSIMRDDLRAEDHPYADANCDGVINEDDIALVQDLIDRKEGTTVHIPTYLVDGTTSTTTVTYPLKHIVPLGVNMVTTVEFVNASSLVCAYFGSSYPVSDKAMIDAGGVDLESAHTSGGMSDSQWAKFQEVDSNLISDGGISALLVDYSNRNAIHEANISDLKEAGIPLIIYACADADSQNAAALTIGFLCKGCESYGNRFYTLSNDIMEEVSSKVSGMSDSQRASYICFTMRIYICQNDSSYNTTPATAGGIPYYKVNSEFASKYAGTSSTKMQSHEALSNYGDCDYLISNRSIDYGNDSQAAIDKVIKASWAYVRSGDNYIEYFQNLPNFDHMLVINNLMPGALKVAYLAAAMYPSLFSESWADGYLQQFIDAGFDPLKGQTVSSVIPIQTYADYTDYVSRNA